MYRFILCMSLLLSLGCSGDEESLKGGEGEYCTGNDSDCQQDLACVDFICQQTDALNEDDLP